MPKSLYVPIYLLPDDLPEGTISMLEGDIEGTHPFFHKLHGGSAKSVPSCDEQARVLFLLDGSVVFTQAGQDLIMEEKGSYIPDPQAELTITAREEASILEIAWDLTATDQSALRKHRPDYPVVQLYDQCPRYTEPFKSERTISRTIVRHGILPRFSMGSNEAGAHDRVERNCHPDIDQYFFSFPENDVDLLIEEDRVPFKGNTLIHVPLGCYHGVEIGSGQRMHYIWIDLIVNEEAGLAYLDTVHQPLG